MSRADAWTGGWLSGKILGHPGIVAAEPVEENLIMLSLEGPEEQVMIATISVDRVSSEDIQDVVVRDDIEFVVNIKSDAVITGEALNYAERVRVGIGGVGDLYSAVGARDFREHLSGEATFVLRGLRQHTNVSDVVRLSDRQYLVVRRRLEPVTVLALNDYDMTADAVRSGIDKYGTPGIILTSNPNCRCSSGAVAAAASAGVSVMDWGQLMGALNHFGS